MSKPKVFSPVKEWEVSLEIARAKEDSESYGVGYRIFTWVTCAIKTDGLDTEMVGRRPLTFAPHRRTRQLGIVNGDDFFSEESFPQPITL